MLYTFHKPRSLLNLATGGLIPGLAEKPAKAKVPSADTAQKKVEAESEEAARRLRAKEKLRKGVQSTLSSGTTAGTFASTASSKPSLLG